MAAGTGNAEEQRTSSGTATFGQGYVQSDCDESWAVSLWNFVATLEIVMDMLKLLAVALVMASASTAASAGNTDKAVSSLGGVADDIYETYEACKESEDC